MKKLLLLLPLIIIGLLLVVNTGCENPLEDCSSDTVCDGKDPVTTCCTDGSDCVYKYNGREYPDTDKGLSDLLDAMNCTSKKSATVSCDEELIRQRLSELLNKTKALSLR